MQKGIPCYMLYVMSAYAYTQNELKVVQWPSPKSTTQINGRERLSMWCI